MRIDIHHHFHFGPVPGLDQIFSHLRAIEGKLTQMDQAIQDGLDELKADVEALTAVDESAITLIEGFAQKLADAIAAAQAAGASPEQLQSIQDLHTGITSETQRLADAVAANTPAAPSA